MDTKYICKSFNRVSIFLSHLDYFFLVALIATLLQGIIDGAGIHHQSPSQFETEGPASSIWDFLFQRGSLTRPAAIRSIAGGDVQESLLCTFPLPVNTSCKKGILISRVISRCPYSKFLHPVSLLLLVKTKVYKQLRFPKKVIHSLQSWIFWGIRGFREQRILNVRVSVRKGCFSAKAAYHQ